MASKQKYNWPKIQADHLAGRYPTITEQAKSLGMRPSYLSKRLKQLDVARQLAEIVQATPELSKERVRWIDYKRKTGAKYYRQATMLHSTIDSLLTMLREYPIHARVKGKQVDSYVTNTETGRYSDQTTTDILKWLDKATAIASRLDSMAFRCHGDPYNLSAHIAKLPNITKPTQASDDSDG